MRGEWSETMLFSLSLFPNYLPFAPPPTLPGDLQVIANTPGLDSSSTSSLRASRRRKKSHSRISKLGSGV